MQNAAVALLTLPMAASVSNMLDLKLLPANQYVGGKCMDGTPAGYYYGPPSSGSSTLWVIFLKGGGGCSTKEDCDTFAAGNDGQKGGSTNWAVQMAGGEGGGFMSSDPNKNPDFHDAHHVYVPYCTGDSHSGQVSNPTKAVHWGYYFDGHLNVKAIAEHIYSTIPEAPQMTQLLFQGSSAGGRGVFFNCDFLQDHLMQLGASVSVKCHPSSGWFMPGNIQERADPAAPPTPWEYWSVGSMLPANVTRANPHDTYLHPGCVAAMGAASLKCMSVHIMYQYITTLLCAYQDMFDYNIIFQQLQLPSKSLSSEEGKKYVAYIGNCTKVSMNQIVEHPQGKQGDGMFMPACLNHGGGNVALGGIRRHAALGHWFFGRSTAPLISMGDCASTAPYLPCTPGCRHIPNGGACQERMEVLCGDANTRQKCMLCARDNAAEMGAAGCSQNSVMQLCNTKFDGAVSSVLHRSSVGIALTSVLLQSVL